MRPKFFLAPAALVALAAAGSLASAQPKASQPGASKSDVQSLIAQEDKLSDACRDGRGPDHGAGACNASDKLFARLKKLGVCWGIEGQSEADKHWRPCTDTLADTAAGPGGAPANSVQFDNGKRLQNLRLQSALAVRDRCVRSAIELALVQGLRDRTEIISKTAAYCLSPLTRAGVMTPQEAFADTQQAAADWIDTVAREGQ